MVHNDPSDDDPSCGCDVCADGATICEDCPKCLEEFDDEFD